MRLIAALAILLAMALPARAQPNPMAVGIDYVQTAAGLTGCPAWSWLQAGCYRNNTLTASHVSPHDLLASDIQFIRANHLGSFQRVWISLDELMLWDTVRGYQGYGAGEMADVDDMLHQFAATGISVDLVLYTVSNTNGFHPESLDGLHEQMRQGYRAALFTFMSHIASDPQDGQAVRVADLFNEGYYSLEQYYLKPANLGVWTNCLQSNGSVATSCVDQQILHPWFSDLYAIAHLADPAIAYTISDTGRLLTTDAAAQAYWVSMYPVDTYDIHLYQDQPWATPARWASGLALPKPWFAGEAGCSSGNVGCSYNGSRALSADGWWLANMAADGAQAVLVEDRRTVFTYPYVINGIVPTLTPLGQLITGRG